jgi:WS/DGAT/MGAT family acyltransferase
MRERVVPGLGRLSPPEWRPDTEFDLDYHVRHLALPPPGTRRQLYDLAAVVYQDPFDRTRPLWVFFVIEGLEGGESALFVKLHHSLADGISALRLTSLYMDRERYAGKAPDVDLDEILREAAASEEAERRANDNLRAVTTRTVGHTWRRQLGIARRTVGEVALWGADPTRPLDTAGGVVRTVQQARGQLTGGTGAPGGSPLWKTRSRHRHVETLRVPLHAVKDAAKLLGGTINDFFVAGAVIGAVAYHDERSTPVDALNISFVVSTREDRSMGGNAFTPTRLRVSGTPMSPEERFALLHEQMASKRSEVRGAGMLASVAGVANLLPTSMVTRVARSQVKKMDFATSNMRGSKVPLYVAGAKVLETYPLGPVAGTAFNLTTLSYNGSLDIGVFIDPVAVAEPDDLRRCLERGYHELIAAARAEV